MLPPEKSSDLIPFQDHVLLKLKDKWRIQLTIKNCNKKAAWDLLTHEKYSKIHALIRFEKINLKGQKKVFQFDPAEQNWLELDPNQMGL